MPGGLFPPESVWQEWPAGNYDNPVTKPKYLLAFACLLGPISFAVLFARLWVRLRIQRNPGWDDWIMIMSLLPILSVTILTPYATQDYYFNRHIWDVDPKHWVVQRKLVMAINSLFCLSCGLIKLSIVLFCRRLSSRVISPVFQKVLRVATIAISIQTVFFTFIPVFQCHPVAAFWDQVDLNKFASGYKYKCMDEGALGMAYGVTATIQDFLVASLLVVLCWNLKISSREKVALYGIIAFGYVTVLLGSLRTWAVHQTYFTTYDITWISSKVWLFTLLEMHIGTICANLPALRVFFAHFLDDRPWSGLRSRSRTGAHTPEDITRVGSPTRFWSISRDKLPSWDRLPSWDKLPSLEKVSLWKRSHLVKPTSQQPEWKPAIYAGKQCAIIETRVQYVGEEKMSGARMGSTSDRMGSVSDVEALPAIAPRAPSRWELLRARFTNVNRPIVRTPSLGSSLGCMSSSDIEALPQMTARESSRMSRILLPIARLPTVHLPAVHLPTVSLPSVRLPPLRLSSVRRPAPRLPSLNLPPGWASMRA